MEPIILCIETATKVCSVAIYKGDKLLGIEEMASDQYIHSEKLAIFIQNVLEQTDLTATEINAVALSCGPGSYTGLRIGTATAKGFCFGQDLPLIAIKTLDQLASRAISDYPDYDAYIPMLDAKRMEVYSAIYSGEHECLEKTSAVIIDNDSFSDYIGKSIAIFGDGAEKCVESLSHLDVTFIDVNCSARNMGKLALDKFKSNDFEDLAYFEPFYLKDFIAGKPKKLI